jgi:hypothetical protein
MDTLTAPINFTYIAIFGKPKCPEFRFEIFHGFM